MFYTLQLGDDFSTDERTLNLRKSIDVLSRTSNCISNSRLFLSSISFPPQYIIVRYNNVVPRQETKFHFPFNKSACIIECSIRSTKLLAKFAMINRVAYRSKKPLFIYFKILVINHHDWSYLPPRLISNASTQRDENQDSPLVHPVDGSTGSHHRWMSRPDRPCHRVTRSKRASRWHTVLGSAKRLTMRGKVRIPRSRRYERRPRGTGSADELRWPARRRAEWTRPGPIIRGPGIIGWRWEARRVGRWSRARCRGAARRWWGSILRGRGTRGWSLIRRRPGWTTSATGERARALEGRITRWTTCIVVRTGARATTLANGVGCKGRCLRAGRRALPRGWCSRILQCGSGCQWRV